MTVCWCVSIGSTWVRVSVCQQAVHGCVSVCDNRLYRAVCQCVSIGPVWVCVSVCQYTVQRCGSVCVNRLYMAVCQCVSIGSTPVYMAMCVVHCVNLCLHLHPEFPGYQCVPAQFAWLHSQSARRRLPLCASHNAPQTRPTGDPRKYGRFCLFVVVLCPSNI